MIKQIGGTLATSSDNVRTNSRVGYRFWFKATYIQPQSANLTSNFDGTSIHLYLLSTIHFENQTDEHSTHLTTSIFLPFHQPRQLQQILHQRPQTAPPAPTMPLNPENPFPSLRTRLLKTATSIYHRLFLIINEVLAQISQAHFIPICGVVWN
jgi:hypothetical protein